MPKYRNRYGEVTEFEDPTSYFNREGINHKTIRWYFNRTWLPFLYEEFFEKEAPNSNVVRLWDTFKFAHLDYRPNMENWHHRKQYLRSLGDIWNRYKKEGTEINDLWRRVHDEDKAKIFNKQTTFTGIDFLLPNLFSPFPVSSMVGEQYFYQMLLNLDQTYRYDPDLERKQREQERQRREQEELRRVEQNRLKELDSHIQQLNKHLEVSQQQNSRLQQNVDFLNREQNRIINETKNTFQQQANKLTEYSQQTQSAIQKLSNESQVAFNQSQQNTAEAFKKFQTTVAENLQKRGEEYDRNLENFRVSAENELSNIKQNHGVLMEKLRNRMKRRMLSDAPEMKASYNFFEDIFAGNK